MIKNCSHLVIATDDVKKLSDFFCDVFEVKSCYENDLFSEFILESEFRIAFFKPIEANKQFFDTLSSRKSISLGVTVEDVDKTFEKVKILSKKHDLEIGSEPKDHPWGFRSFVLIDPDKNRWEVTQSPTKTGMLKEIDLAKTLKAPIC